MLQAGFKGGLDRRSGDGKTINPPTVSQRFSLGSAAEVSQGEELDDMRLLDLTLPTAAENLALDEALLEQAEEHPGSAEILRLWECPQVAVVLGRANRATTEADLAACGAAQVPVLRRSSGGGTVVIGPGCLMYSLLLSYDERPHFRMLDVVHRQVLSTMAGALNRHLQAQLIAAQGESDLTLGAQKISGNSVRCKRHYLLYHGTLLYGFDLALVQRLLRPPSKQPEYRHDREHHEFVVNLPLAADQLRAALIEAWVPTGSLTEWPQNHVEQLVRDKYSQASWNFER
jgi:lipoate-protein ligase A